MKGKLYYFVIFGLILSLFLTSCGKKYIGYGVILWNKDSNGIQNGEIVRVRQQSNIRKTYLIEKNDEELEIGLGFLRFFGKRGDAESFARGYSEYINTFAFSLNNGLPIREEPKANAKRIYKLRKGEVIKVISRGEKKEAVGAYENYWYDVLTEDGHEGYCYGQFLRVFQTKGNPVEMVKRLMAEDPVLNSILEKTWRPEYFKEMLEENKFDLNKFRMDIGFFPNRDEKVIKLVTDKYSLVFRYTGVDKIGENRYLFKGSDLRVTVYGKDKIAIFYNLEGKNVSGVYVSVEEDIQKVIQGEIERRDAIYESLLERGKQMSSRFYGNIILSDNRRFVWQNPGKLKGRIIPREAGDTGVVDFNYYLSEKIAKDYDGVITFYFDGVPRDRGVDFLYRTVNNGLRLVYVDRNNIENLIVKGTSVPPVILYFSYTEQTE